MVSEIEKNINGMNVKNIRRDHFKQERLGNEYKIAEKNSGRKNQESKIIER